MAACLAAAAACLGACGDEPASDDPDGRATTTSGGRADRDPGMPQPRADGPPDQSGVTDGQAIPRRGGDDNGIVLPAPPEQKRVEPSVGCVEDRGVLLPPTPGLEARGRAGRVVRVTYAVPRAPVRCKPYRIRLTVNVSASGLSQTEIYPLRADGRQTVRVPAHFAAEPDVIRASTVTRQGRRGLVASVLIR